MGSWKDDYLTGISLCDEQHKELFRILDKCIDLSRQSKYLDKTEEMSAVIEELLDYTIYHFEAEEKHMLEIGYRRFLSHKVQHDTFIKTLKDFEMNEDQDKQEEEVSKILQFVLDWIGEHILVIDKNIMNYLR